MVPTCEAHTEPDHTTLLFACSVQKYGHRKIHVEPNIPIFDNIQNPLCYRGNIW